MPDVPGWKDSVADLAHKALGPITEQVGLHWGDRARVWREMNTLSIVRKAEIRRNLVRTPIEEIPASVLVHVLARGSLTDDETLQLMWADLLLRASSNVDIAERTAIFSGILAELDPLGAKIINKAGSSWSGGAFAREEFSYEMMGLEFLREATGEESFRNSTSRLEARISIDNLVRLQLLEKVPEVQHDGFSRAGFSFDNTVRFKLKVSDLGRAFIEACTLPEMTGNPAPTEADSVA
jgi:hypothetical protein